MSPLRQILVLIAGWLLVVLGAPVTARAGETVDVCGYFGGGLLAAQAMSPNFKFGLTCPDGYVTIQSQPDQGTTRQGQDGLWQVVAPAGLQITGATVPVNGLYSTGVNVGSSGQYGGEFFWAGGGSLIEPGESAASFGPFSSPYFGWLLVCGVSTCRDDAAISVQSFQVAVSETTPPHITSPSGIGQATGWVRGNWDVGVWGDSPSGLCGLSVYFGGRALPGTSSPRDPSQWHQCATGPVSDPIATTGYAQGADTLYVAAYDAAGETVSETKTVDVDNQTPAVSLSGPTDASSAAGPQYVTARATAGPSGVAGIACSVDGGPSAFHAARTVAVAVSGIGSHVVRCYAENNARSASGALGTSASESFTMKIGQPTVTAVAFSRLVDGLRCRRVTERVHSRGRPARTIHVRRCHLRTARRRVTVWVRVRRHGRRVRVREHRIVRVVLVPHEVSRSRAHVRHGRGVTVSGWLGTTAGVPIGGAPVQVLAAPDDGRDAYVPVTTVTTAADGGWSARLPAGPSRLITASYAGGPTTEGSLAAPVRLSVPAEVHLLSVTPRRVPWGATVRLTGRLIGGYLPPGGALVRLRIGLGHTYITYGVHEHVGGTGLFRTHYTFGLGDPSVRRAYWFQIASLPMGDYPYTPSSSRRIAVLVGGHPRTRRR